MGFLDFFFIINFNKYWIKVIIIGMSFSRRQDNYEGTYLIQKYGLECVQTLIDYLQNSYCSQQINLKEAKKLKDQLRYLKTQKQKHFDKQKKHIIQHIAQCIQDQKITILQQFEQQRRQNLDQFISEASQIQKQLQDHHQNQMIKFEAQLDKGYHKFVNKKSQRMLQLTHQLNQLCIRQQYESAEQVQRKLQKQQRRNLLKKQQQFLEHRKNQIQCLKSKQQKQMNSLRYRLQLMADQELKNRNQEFSKLLRKIDMCKNKVVEKVKKDPKYRNQINQLASSRYSLRVSRNCSVQNSRKKVHQEWKNEPETGPSSQAHTDRFSPILDEELRR